MQMAGSPGRRPISPPNSSAPSEARGRRQVWGRRKGPGLSARQTGLLDTLLPELALRPEHGRDPRAYFHEDANSPLRSRGRDVSDVWLEIGFGAGEHLLWQAQTHPEIGIIGCEPYLAGMAKLLTKLRPLAPAGGEGRGEGVTLHDAPPPHPAPLPQGGRGNLRLYQDDARAIIEALPDASIGRVFILFPDPWPKTRHHKRRFIQMAMLDHLARVMRAGAELRFATDDAGYLTWALERLMVHRAFAWLAHSATDWRVRPSDWPQTRYEAKAIKQGRACTYLRFERVVPP